MVCKNKHDWYADFDEINVDESSAMGTLQCIKCNWCVDIRWKHKSGSFDATGCNHEIDNVATTYETGVPVYKDDVKCTVSCQNCTETAEFVYEFENFLVYIDDDDGYRSNDDCTNFEML